MNQISTDFSKQALKSNLLSEIQQKSILAQAFWASHEDTYFGQDTLCAVANIKPATAEGYRCRGGGPIYRKVAGKCLYQKKSILTWLEQFPSGRSTAEIEQAA